MRKSAIFYFIALGLAAASCALAAAGPTAKVAGGQIRGRALPNKGGVAFQGVPFAQPPVGDLRWREPQPVKPWSGVRETVKAGAPCAQPASGWNNAAAAVSSEDCLYLDVWTPEFPAKTRKPVMVWIHGGGNTAGSGGFDTLYDGARLISHGVVLVVLQYRLGAFGFLAHPELTKESPHHVSGNYAILDQLAALQWVHDNIAKLGGDPGNVTIFGQSAGSWDVSSLVATPLAKGLIHRAIAESGAVATGAIITTLADAERGGQRFTAGLKAPEEGQIKFLRSLTTGQVLKGPRGASNAIVDGWVFPAPSAAIYSAGKQNAVPMIVGSNAIEFASQTNADVLRRQLQSTFRELAPKALELYGVTTGAGTPDPVYGTPADQWSADSQFRCPGIIQGELHAAAGNPTWEYQFDRAIPPKPAVSHSGELCYVFGNLLKTGGSQPGDFVEADRKLSDVMQAYWTNFAKTGDPNGKGLPAWPKYSAASRKFMEFTQAAEVKAGENQRRAYCEIIEENLRRPATQ
jgi:para-nitrobenzyl esterase